MDRFVAKHDTEKLNNIVDKIINDTLKDETSIIVLYGDGANGKSTLMDIMYNIAPSTGRISPNLFLKKHTSNNDLHHVEQINKSIIFVGEQETKKCNETIESIQAFIRKMSNCFVRPIMSREDILLKPGVFVFAMNTKPVFKVEKYRRNITVFELPHHFKCDIPSKEIVENVINELGC